MTARGLRATLLTIGNSETSLIGCVAEVVRLLKLATQRLSEEPRFRGLTQLGVLRLDGALHFERHGGLHELSASS